MAYGNEVGCFRDDGKPIGAAHWAHGRLAGYAVRGSARSIELGPRAYDAQNVERTVSRSAQGDLVGMLVERVRYGKGRATATEEPFGPGTGALPWGDLYQPGRELRAAGLRSEYVLL